MGKNRPTTQTTDEDAQFFSDSDEGGDKWLLTKNDLKVKADWKPAKFVSYESFSMCKTDSNPVIRPCGFRTDNRPRKIKETCLLARMKNLNILNETTPKMACCITMYNEDFSELQFTLKGIIQNYNVMALDPKMKMKQ